jgi:hypothetical protein
MATVKILYDQSAKNMEEYLKRKREQEGPTTEHSCKLDTLAGEFDSSQFERGSKGNHAIHLIQSWSPAESKKLSREEIHAMGVELVNRFAPGHQYVVQTHTEEAHAHNHIVLNPVSIETGKRIRNKLGHIRTLRGLNDDIARERGLSVLPPQEKLRLSGPTELNRRIDAYRGRSYIVDLANKADFARHHATNYDEYLAFLNAFDINVRVEPKNITYFYPGREHGKRGRNLGPELDKPGLEARFQRNWERVQSSPEAKRSLAELVSEYRQPPSTLTQQAPQANRAKERVSARAEGVTTPLERTLVESFLPIEELRRAKTQSILDYCAREKVGLDRTPDGRHTLRGRDYVEVSDFTWINHKNKTRGNVIDFVANHRQVSFLHALAALNQNPRLLLLEQHLGAARKRFQSFYVPREDAAPRPQALQHLSRLLNLAPSHPVHATLFKKQRVHVSTRGVIAFLSDSDAGAAAEYEPDARGTYSLRRRGAVGRPFFESRGGGRELHLYVEPKTFLQFETDAFLNKGPGKSPILALFEPDLAQTHRTVAAAPTIQKVRLLVAPEIAHTPEVVRFHDELRASLNPFSIDIQLAWEPVREPPLEITATRQREVNPGLGR